MVVVDFWCVWYPLPRKLLLDKIAGCEVYLLHRSFDKLKTDRGATLHSSPATSATIQVFELLWPCGCSNGVALALLGVSLDVRKVAERPSVSKWYLFELYEDCRAVAHYVCIIKLFT